MRRFEGRALILATMPVVAESAINQNPNDYRDDYEFRCAYANYDVFLRYTAPGSVSPPLLFSHSHSDSSRATNRSSFDFNWVRQRATSRLRLAGVAAGLGINCLPVISVRS